MSLSYGQSEVEVLANEGNAEAQNKLGDLYKHGVNRDIDFEKAVDWYSKSAKQGNSQGIYSLGYMYYKGFGVPQSYEKAFEYFKQSDYSMAKHYLAKCYYFGYGVKQDQYKAARLMSKDIDEIENNRAFLGYIISRRIKELKKEKNPNKFIHEKSDTTKINSLLIEKENDTNSSNIKLILKDIFRKKIRKAQLVEYDWSNSEITRVLPIKLKTKKDVFSLKVNNESYSSSPIFKENFIAFDSLEIKLEKLYTNVIGIDYLKWDISSIEVEIKRLINGEKYFVGKLDYFSETYNEPGAPLYLIFNLNNNDYVHRELINNLTKEEDGRFIKVYPVPFKEKVTIEYNLLKDTNVMIEITNISGQNKQILKNKSFQKKGNYKEQFNIKGVSGLYIIKVITDDKVVKNKIIIKE